MSEEPQRLPDGRFAPGQSGNPTGQRKGAVSLAAALQRCLTPAAAEKIASKLIDLAQDGDVVAMRILFERIDGKVEPGIAMQFNLHQQNVTQKDKQIDYEEFRRMAGAMLGVSAINNCGEPLHPAQPDTEAKHLPGTASS